ncbi:MAG: dTMP kinase [Limnohabitans sp.]|nr:dTMP kinase [Limnohabitans sp.]
MAKGLFISFEGIDGAGKSTHVEALARAFKQAQRRVTLTREPGGTPLAEKLRNMVLNDVMDPLTEALLIFSARRDHLKNMIEPALERGDVVLCDRFTDATFAYQGHGRQFNLEVLSQLERWVQQIENSTQLRQPDMTLWFSLDPSIAAKRLVGARIPDRFESQPIDFFQKVHLGYQSRMNASPQRFVCINADQTKEQVWGDVVTTMTQKQWLLAHDFLNSGQAS